MTELRPGDMQRLRWSNIKDVNGVQMVSVINDKAGIEKVLLILPFQVRIYK